MLALDAYPALLLNADFQPMRAAPLSRYSWRDAVENMVAGKVIPVAWYDKEVRTPSSTFRLPSVVALKEYVDRNLPAAFTRYNLFLAHDFHCGYCGDRFDPHELTFEHVLPRCQGGETHFLNIVPACEPCNSRKGGRTPERAGMRLRRQPYWPTIADLNRIGRKYPPAHCHQTWLDFAYWDAELER